MIPEHKEFVQGLHSVYKSPKSSHLFPVLHSFFLYLALPAQVVKKMFFLDHLQRRPRAGGYWKAQIRTDSGPIHQWFQTSTAGAEVIVTSFLMFPSPDCGRLLHWSLHPAGLPHCCLPRSPLLGSNSSHPGANLCQTTEVLLSAAREH